MCSNQKSAAKIDFYLRNTCCTGVFRHFSEYTPPSFLSCCRDLGSSCRCLCARGDYLPVLQYRQARQQETRTEIAPIDAAIDDCSRALNPPRPQGFSQLIVTPIARPHLAFYQLARFLPPFLHRLRFSLRSAGFGVNGYRTTDSFHVRTTQFSENCKRQLESILARSHSSWLHLCPIFKEVTTHA